MSKKCVITLFDQKQDYSVAIAKLTEMGIETRWKKDEVCNSLDENIVIEHCKGYNYVIAGYEVWNKIVFKECTDLELLVRYGAGYECINLKEAEEAGIAVANLPGVNAETVAEQAVGLILAACRKISFMDRLIHNGNYSDANFTVPQLSGKTVGVLGCGKIGKNLIRMLEGFNCNFLAYDKYPDQAFAADHNVTFAGLDSVLASSDIISIHLPMLPDTKWIICKENIDKMKEGVVIVNTSRGGLVKSQDLAYALKSGKVFAAGLDVYEDENNIKTNNPFQNLSNVVMTPHVSSATFETYSYMMELAVEIIADYKAGKTIKSILNPGYVKNK